MTRGRHPVEATRPAPGSTLERAALAAQVLRERLGMAREAHPILHGTAPANRLHPSDVDALVGTVMALVADDTDLRTAGHLRRASRAVLGLNPDAQLGSDYRGGLRRAARYLHTLADRYDRAHGVHLPASTDPVEADDLSEVLGPDSDWEYADVWTVGARRPHRLYRDQAAVRAARERDAQPAAERVEKAAFPAPQFLTGDAADPSTWRPAEGTWDPQTATWRAGTAQTLTAVYLTGPDGTESVLLPHGPALDPGDSLEFTSIHPALSEPQRWPTRKPAGG